MPVPTNNHPFLEIYHLSLEIQRLGDKLESETGLGLTQWCILKILIDRPSVSSQSLAKAVGLHPSTLGQAIKRLQKKKYVFLNLDPSDARKKSLSITRDGRSALNNTTKVIDQWLNDRPIGHKGLQNMITELEALAPM